MLVKKYFLLCVTVLLLSTTVNKNLFAGEDSSTTTQKIEAPVASSEYTCTDANTFPELDWTLNTAGLDDIEAALDAISIETIEQVEKENPQKTLSWSKTLRIAEIYLGMKLDDAGRHIKDHKNAYELAATGVISVCGLAFLIWIVQKYR
jgi:hypothetical protein